jgi:hypothetical protein
MIPLKGSHYSNLFAHFYPRGDTEWASKEGNYCSSPRGRTEAKCTHEGSVEELITVDASEAVEGERIMTETGSAVQRLQCWEDLYKRWKMCSPVDNV